MELNVRRMILSEFDDLWRFIVNRSASFPVVQEYNELKYVYELMRGCESYLEIGTAEGNSLYILAHALKKGSKIALVDYGEKHTAEPREQILNLLKPNQNPIQIYGSSHNHACIDKINELGKFDVVLIDAGHSYEDVIADSIAYGGLATKYIIFHDVCLPEVMRAFEWYLSQRSDWEAYKFINSETFGYGILRKK